MLLSASKRFKGFMLVAFKACNNRLKNCASFTESIFHCLHQIHSYTFRRIEFPGIPLLMLHILEQQ